MTPTVGSTCLFTFSPRFVGLNGVYTVTGATPFLKCVATGVDFVANLYTPAGLTESDFSADYNGYTKDVVMVLQSVINSSIIYYVPESVLGGIPDPTIREYFPLLMTIDLGVQANTQSVLPVIDAVTDIVKSVLGTTNVPKIMTNSSNKVYLTDSEYAVLTAAREANKVAISPLSVQLQAEKDKNALLAAKLAAYEALIKQMGTPSP